MFCEGCGATVGSGHAACDARLAATDPPRWCAACGRRLVVQVLPFGWRARCSEHGERTS